MHRLVIALVTLIGLTGVTFLAGYLLLFSASTDRAAALAPANSAFYLNVYLQPSTGQQMNLGGLIGRLPGFADEASLDEKVDQVVENLLGSTGIGLNYREDVKPWLGDQVAIAAWPSEADAADAEVVLIAEVKDVQEAENALAELASSGGATFEEQTHGETVMHVAEGSAYAFVGEMLVFGESAVGIEAAVDAGGGAGSLADRDDFTRTMADLAADHLASAFIDLSAIAEATGTAEQLSALSTAGAVLIAERDGIRLSGSAPFDVEGAASSSTAGFGLGGEPSSLSEWMPEDTIAELVIFGLRRTLEDAEAAAAGAPEGEEITQTLDSFRAIAAFGLGIDIDTDLLPLLDREVGVAVSAIDDGGMPRGQILLRPEDPEAAADALTRVADRLAATGATTSTEDRDGTEITTISIPDTVELAYAVRDEMIIIGMGADDVAAAVAAHEDGSSLASADRYVTTFEVAGERAGNEAWVDVGAVVDAMGDAVALPDDARDILASVASFGFTAPSRDDQIEFHAVLTVEEP